MYTRRNTSCQDHGCRAELTGKTRGIPPRMGFDPSRMALLLSQSCSAPFASFHEMIVAPKRLTVIDSPVASRATTLFPSVETTACAAAGGTPMALGLLARSIVVVVIGVVVVMVIRGYLSSVCLLAITDVLFSLGRNAGMKMTNTARL